MSPEDSCRELARHVVESDYSEIATYIEKPEGDIKTSLKYLVKEDDKEWWRSFFENYDEIGIYLVGLNFTDNIFVDTNHSHYYS